MNKSYGGEGDLIKPKVMSERPKKIKEKLKRLLRGALKQKRKIDEVS